MNEVQNIPAPAFKMVWLYRSNTPGLPSKRLGNIYADDKQAADHAAAAKWPDESPILDAAFTADFVTEPNFGA